MEAAFRWALAVTNLDEGIYGLDSRDAAYGVEILKLRIRLPLGLKVCSHLRAVQQARIQDFWMLRNIASIADAYLV